MTESQISNLINLGYIAAIVLIIVVIWFIIWSAIFIPIRKKDDYLKKRDAAEIELQQIKAQISIEWDKFKNITEENDTLRKSYFQFKDKVEHLQEDIAKLEADKAKILNVNKELKKEISKTSSD